MSNDVQEEEIDGTNLKNVFTQGNDGAKRGQQVPKDYKAPVNMGGIPVVPTHASDENGQPTGEGIALAGSGAEDAPKADDQTAPASDATPEAPVSTDADAAKTA
jgi:hypothetical protein